MIVATGPLTSDALSADHRAAGRRRAPRISTTRSARSCSPEIDRHVEGVPRVAMGPAVWRSSRRCGDPGCVEPAACGVDDGQGDYLNCPLTRERVRALLRRARHRRIGDGPRLRQGDVLRRLPADRGDGAPRTRHAAVRPDEAGRPRRSAHRARAVCRRAAAAGQPGRRSLQPRRLPDADQVGRSGARAAADSGPRARGVRPLRHGPPQHLRERADGAGRDVAGARRADAVLRRARCRASKATSSRRRRACSPA